MSLGFSVRYWSTFSSANSSNIFIASTYKGVNYLRVLARSSVVTQTFVLAWQKLMTFLCQFFLMRAVFSQGLPSSMGYAPGALSFRTTADIRNTWPPMVISRSRISHVGRTKQKWERFPFLNPQFIACPSTDHIYSRSVVDDHVKYFFPLDDYCYLQ